MGSLPSPWPRAVGDLTLRIPTAPDIEQVVAFRNLPDVNRFMIRTSVDPAALRDELSRIETSMTDFSCVAVRDETVVALGFLDIVDGVGQPGMPAATQGSIGYIVHPEYWSQGIASALVPALLGAAFDTLGLRRVSAACTAANVASARAMEGAGMRREKHGVADEWHSELGWVDSYGYAILAEEWRIEHG
jgi:RimJ/RimL family protein N-acetyltransferase